MKKILFVCHGNICRSPMAEFIFKEIIKTKGLENSFYTESRATSTEELGNPVYPPAKAELGRHGISCEGKYSTQMTTQDYNDFDYIFVMDERNLKNIRHIIGTDTENKVYKLLEYTNTGTDVPDPWYYGNYESVYNSLWAACNALSEMLL